MEEGIKQKIQESIITALTIATALIWKEFIMRLLELVVGRQQLLYHFLTALAATILVTIAIYVYIKTTNKIQRAFDRLSHK